MTDDSLQPLITRCPTCRTRFRVTEAQLEVAAGRVRCGACLSVFAGLEHLVFDSQARRRTEDAHSAIDALIDELRADPAVEQGRVTRTAAAHAAARSPSDRPRVDPLGEPATRADVAEAASPVTAPRPKVDAPKSPDRATRSKVQAPRSADAMLAPEAPAAGSSPVIREPKSEREPRREVGRTAAAAIDLDIGPQDLVDAPRRRRRWWLPLAAMVGGVLFGAEVLYLQFDVWAKNQQLRPVYAWWCATTGCALPVLRALDQIYSKNLVVRANPDAPGTLLVDALVVNQAPFPQPFPELELRFSAVGGSLVSARRFRPEEYLGGELKGATLIAPMTPVHIALEIADPGDEAVNYVMVFR